MEGRSVLTGFKQSVSPWRDVAEPCVSLKSDVMSPLARPALPVLAWGEFNKAAPAQLLQILLSRNFLQVTFLF